MASVPLPPVAKQIIAGAAAKYGIDPAILWGLYGTESGYGSNQGPSSAGAVGPFQFMPATARDRGVNPYDFTSAAQGAAKYLSDYKSRGTAGMLSAYNAGPAGAPQPAYVASVLQNAKGYGGAPVAAVSSATQTPASTPGASQKAAPQPQTPQFTTKELTSVGQVLAPLLGTNNPLYLSGVLKNAPDTIRVPAETQSSSLAPLQPQAKPTVDHPGLADTAVGVVTPKAAWNPTVKPVPAWISPILQWARDHGWRGQVTSGVRTHAQQLQAATSYVAGKGISLAQNYPNGVYASNHISPDWPHGAVDVTDPQALNRILSRYPGKRKLVWGGPTIGDPVHFSSNGH